MTPSDDPYFTKFDTDIDSIVLPNKLVLMLDNKAHELCLFAVKQLQQYLIQQKDWFHNFGLTPNAESPVIGKMFGVLVVQNPQMEIGFLAAFSGKLAGQNQHTKFVPPIFDALTPNSFLNNGMAEISRINIALETLQPQVDEVKISELKAARKKLSATLQKLLFDHYFFVNQLGEQKSIYALFSQFKNPPSAAGECATPKLLQYAFLNQLKPLAIAEFWWGQSPKSNKWKHQEFYPCCKEKCEPILKHMLSATPFVYE